MIIYNKTGIEVEYGRTRRNFIYDKFEDPTPSWLALVGTTSVVRDNLTLTRAGDDNWIKSKAFSISGCDAIRFSVNNFMKTSTNSLVSLQLSTLTKLVEYRTKSSSGPGVGLYVDNVLISDVTKFNFNGALVIKPRKVGIHYCPQTGFIALLENDKVVSQAYITKFNVSETLTLALQSSSDFTTSQIEIISWTSR